MAAAAVAPKRPTPLGGLEVFAGGAPAGVVELRANMGFAGVAWVVEAVLELVLLNKEPPVVPPLPPPPPPNSEAGLLTPVPWSVPRLLACPNMLVPGAVAVVGVVLVAVAFGAAGVLPKRPVPVPVGAAAGLLPNKLVLDGVSDEPPKGLLLAPPPKDGVDAPGVAPKSDFCSPGFVAVLPNTLPPPRVPDEAGVALLPPPVEFWKEKVGVVFAWLPNNDGAAGVVDDPNNPPAAGALEVVALLLGCPEELGVPKRDIVKYYLFRGKAAATDTEAVGYVCEDGT